MIRLYNKDYLDSLYYSNFPVGSSEIRYVEVHSWEVRFCFLTSSLKHTHVYNVEKDISSTLTFYKFFFISGPSK